MTHFFFFARIVIKDELAFSSVICMNLYNKSNNVFTIQIATKIVIFPLLEVIILTIVIFRKRFKEKTCHWELT